MTDAKKRIVDALAKGAAEAEAREEARLLAEKHDAIERARDVIYAALTEWTGITCVSGGSIPIVRDGNQVGSKPELLPNCWTVSGVN